MLPPGSKGFKSLPFITIMRTQASSPLGGAIYPKTAWRLISTWKSSWVGEKKWSSNSDEILPSTETSQRFPTLPHSLPASEPNSEPLIIKKKYYDASALLSVCCDVAYCGGERPLSHDKLYLMSKYNKQKHSSQTTSVKDQLFSVSPVTVCIVVDKVKHKHLLSTLFQVDGRMLLCTAVIDLLKGRGNIPSVGWRCAREAATSEESDVLQRDLPHPSISDTSMWDKSIMCLCGN